MSLCVDRPWDACHTADLLRALSDLFLIRPMPNAKPYKSACVIYPHETEGGGGGGERNACSLSPSAPFGDTMADTKHKQISPTSASLTSLHRTALPPPPSFLPRRFLCVCVTKCITLCVGACGCVRACVRACTCVRACLRARDVSRFSPRNLH